MKKFSVLMMIVFATVFVSACTNPGNPVEKGTTETLKTTNKNPAVGEKPVKEGDVKETAPDGENKEQKNAPEANQKSIKEQIAERNQQKAPDTEEKNTETNEDVDTAKDEENADTEKKSENTGDVVVDSDAEELAVCLTKKGFKMYGTNRCSHCKKQKEKFGASFEKIDFVDCETEKEACTKAGVQGYPTWADAEGKLFPGDQSLEDLAQLAQCTKGE